MDDYTQLLPHINVAEGSARVSNNLKLYKTLLGKFKARELADELITGILENNADLIAKSAHSLKGVAGNLGLKVLEEIAADLDNRIKNNQDCSDLTDRISEATDAYIKCYEELVG